jgi:hypothetical protein
MIKPSSFRKQQKIALTLSLCGGRDGPDSVPGTVDAVHPRRQLEAIGWRILPARSKSPSLPSDIQTKSRVMIAFDFLDVVLINNYACISVALYGYLISCKE